MYQWDDDLCYLVDFARLRLRAKFMEVQGASDWPVIQYLSVHCYYSSGQCYIYIDPNSTLSSEHNDFIWQSTKSWKKCLAWFEINYNQHLQPNLKQDVWKLKAMYRSASTGQASIFDLNLSNLLLKIIIYCVTSNAITCINKRFAVKNSAVCCLTLICIWK